MSTPDTASRTTAEATSVPPAARSVPVDSALAAARESGRAALIGYWPAGFPDLETSISAARTMIENGVDIVELGMPYSDPVMDGPTIQAAAEKSLEGGFRTSHLLEAVREVAATGAPTVVMSYWNPILAYGVERFAADLAAAGGAGLITPDLTPDEGSDWIAAATAHDLDRIFLVAPSSPPHRLDYVAGKSRGFVYAASTMGVTGERTAVGLTARDLVARTRHAGADFVCVGLGVSNAKQGAEVAAFADGVIVGSAFVACVLNAENRAEGLAALAARTREISAGVTSAGPPALESHP